MGRLQVSFVSAGDNQVQIGCIFCKNIHSLPLTGYLFSESCKGFNYWILGFSAQGFLVCVRFIRRFSTSGGFTHLLPGAQLPFTDPKSRAEMGYCHLRH